METLSSTSAHINQKLENSLNRVLLAEGVSLDIPRFQAELESARGLLEAVQGSENYEELGADLAEFTENVLLQEKEMRRILRLLRMRDKEAEKAQRAV